MDREEREREEKERRERRERERREGTNGNSLPGCKPHFSYFKQYITLIL